MRIYRHLIFWVACYLVAALSYPPHGSFGPPNGVEVDGITKYYEMVGIRSFFHILCQMIFCYPLLYFLVPAFLWKRKYWQFAGMLLLLVGDHFAVEIFYFRIYLQPDHAGAEFLRKFPGPNCQEQCYPELRRTGL